MGWWDTWNTVKDTATGWGKSVWNNASLGGATSGIINFSYNTVSRLLEQLPAVPRLTRVAFDPTIKPEVKTKVTNVVKGAARIIAEDAIPLTLVSYAYWLLNQQGEAYLEDNPDEAWLSPHTAMQIGLWAIWAAYGVYATRKGMQLTVRTTVLAIEAGSAFNSMRETPPMDLCIQKNCTTLRFLKGSFRDIIEYWATKAAISFVGYVPVVGGELAAAFNIYHNGRYVTTLVLPELCGPDQERYLREYPELALAHGITHYVLTKFVTSMVEYYTGIPAVFYESTVQQFLLILQIGIASQMTLPPAVKEPQRNIPDPVAAYESAIGFVVDTTALGLKKKIPEMLKKRTVTVIPWEKIPGYAQAVWTNPVSENFIKPLIVPRLLRSKKAFINDPVIPWDPLRARTILAIQNVEEVKAHPLTKLALLSPGVTAEIARPLFGTPKALVEVLLNLMKNDEFMRRLGVFRNEIGGLHRGAPPPLPANKEAFLLSGQEMSPALVSPLMRITNGEIGLDPRTIILPPPLKPSTPRIVEITEEDENKDKKKKEQNISSASPKVVKLDPGLVIKRKGVEGEVSGVGRSEAAFFKKEVTLDPAMVIRQRQSTNLSTAPSFIN